VFSTIFTPLVRRKHTRGILVATANNKITFMEMKAMLLFRTVWG
jgi:hypothetical protein